MRIRSIACAVAVTSLVTACKIQVFVPEGGRVTGESGTFLCEGGEPCELDVRDTTFSETFVAEPGEGYAFTGWKKADRHFCGGSTNPCALSTTNFDVAPPVFRAILASDERFFIEPIFERQASRPALVSAGTYSTRNSVSDTGLNNLNEIVVARSLDLNGDGHFDIVAAGGTFPEDVTCTDCLPEPDDGNQPGVILINNGDNTFTLAEGDRPSSFWVSKIKSADFDGDGRLDLFFSDHGWDAEPYPGYQNQMLLNTEQGFVDITDRLPQLDDFSHNTGVGDIDGDGDVDLVVINDAFGDAPDRPYALINDGNANFTLERDLLPDLWLQGYVYMPEGWEQYGDSSGTVNFTTFSGALADLDGDGLAELVLGQVNWGASAPTRIHWNMGGFYTDTDVTIIPDLAPVFGEGGVQTTEILAGDINRDGRVDLVINGYRGTDGAGRTTQLMINQGERQFTDESDARLGAGRTSLEQGLPAYTLADFNGDGFVDIMAQQTPFYFIDGIAAWLNDGNGYFAPVLASEILNGKSDELYLGNENQPAVPLPHASGLDFAAFNKIFPDYDNNPDLTSFEINLLEEVEPMMLRPGD